MAEELINVCLGDDDDDEFQTFSTKQASSSTEEFNQLNITGISDEMILNNNVIFDTSQLEKYQDDEEQLFDSYTSRSYLTQSTPRTSRFYERKTPSQGVTLRDPIEHHQIISRASDCIKHLKTAVNSPISSSTQEESSIALSALKIMDSLDYSAHYESYQSPYEQKLNKIAHVKARLTEKASPRYMEPKKQITPPKESFTPQLNIKSSKSSPRYLDFMKSPKQEKSARQVIQEKKELEQSKRITNIKSSPNKSATSPRGITSPRNGSFFKFDSVPSKTNTSVKKPIPQRKSKRNEDNVFELSNLNESLEENLLDEEIEGVLYGTDDHEFSNLETTLSELDEIGLESFPEESETVHNPEIESDRVKTPDKMEEDTQISGHNDEMIQVNQSVEEETSLNDDQFVVSNQTMIEEPEPEEDRGIITLEEENITQGEISSLEQSLYINDQAENEEDIKQTESPILNQCNQSQDISTVVENCLITDEDAAEENVDEEKFYPDDEQSPEKTENVANEFGKQHVEEPITSPEVINEEITNSEKDKEDTEKVQNVDDAKESILIETSAESTIITVNNSTVDTKNPKKNKKKNKKKK